MANEKFTSLTIPLLKAKKASGEKIVAVTAYDFPTARLADEAGMDIILVGDSLGMVVLGYENTLPVTMEEMVHHTRAVSRGVKRAFLVADMPYFSFHLSPDETIKNAARFIKEAGAKAVKIEGASPRRLEVIEALIEAEIPVMGHIGLTPQSIYRFGQYRLRGSDWEEAKRIIKEARELEKRGCFSLVIECVPEELGKIITEEVSIPTIGIGAGRFCDGQILVFHDLVGLTDGHLPKFVRKYADLASLIKEALMKYAREVIEGIYPDLEHTYHLKPDQIKFLSRLKTKFPRSSQKKIRKRSS
ncbi:MAG: 3-methyl-2-oxobutanoate hydroxymethyltransferase [Candidatus Aminicenantes bacterium]|nr:3-methyl-2-oxobutanoate hydroxymethyltransferase [Candidatus Aminicenantes bacterium]